MSQTVVVNGQNFVIPDVGNEDWGQNLTDYFVALAVVGSLSQLFMNFVNVTSSPVAVISGRTFLVDTTAARTLNLPAAALNAFFLVRDKNGNADTNNITINRFGSEQIDGASANKILATKFGCWLFFSNGTDWFSLWHNSDSSTLWVATAMLQNNAVTTAKILDANVTSAKIADDNVITAKIANSNVTTPKIAANNVTLDKLSTDINRWGFRNKIINGNFNIFQRGISFVSPVVTTYVSDRWAYEVSGVARHTITRDTDVPTLAESGSLSNFSLKIDCTTVDASIAAGDFTRLFTIVEGYNWALLAQKAFTLSFWVKATKTGIYCVSFRNSGINRSFVSEYTVNASDTWEYKTINILASPSSGTWNYTDGIGLIVEWALATGSTYHTTPGAWQTGNFVATANQVNSTDNVANNFFLSQVQLENGSTATPLENVNFSEEVGRCQRYYQKSYNIDVTPATVTSVGALLTRQNTTNHIEPIPFRVSMRSAPSMTSYSPATGASGKWRDTSASLDRDCTFNDTGMNISNGNLSTTGVAGNVLSGHWTADAEL